MLEIRTIPDRLADIIRDRILSGEIPPEVAIRQDSLAAELHTSKIPLREALVRLERDGLLVSHPNRGFFVRPMSTREAEEVFDLRLKIEPDAAAFACKAATAAEQQEAARALQRLVVAAATHDTFAGALNRAFHLALVRPGGQVVTTNAVRGLHLVADRYVRKHLEPYYRHLRVEQEHQEILDAWLKPDSGRVRRLLHAHLELTLKDLRVQLSEEAAAGKTVAKRPGVPGAGVHRASSSPAKSSNRRPV